MTSLFPQIDGTLCTGVTATRSLAGGSPENIVDGDTGTTDALATSENYWQLDLGSVKNICKYRFYPTGNSYSFRVYMSDTGAFAGEEYYVSRLGLEVGGLGYAITRNAWNSYYVNPLISARYIRVYNEGNNYSIAEFEVYETTTTAFGSLSSDNTTLDGAINSQEEFLRRTFFDKNIGAYPSGAYLNLGKYFQIDLGSLKSIAQVYSYINPTTSRYTIKVSTTGAFAGEEVTVWNDASSRDAGAYNDTTNLPLETRYIRYITTANTFFSELDVYEPSTITVQKNILSTLQQTVSSDIDTLFSLCIGKNIDFNLFGEILENKNVNLSLLLEILNDSDISFELSNSTLVYKTIYLNLLKEVLLGKDINIDLLKNLTSNYNISTDLLKNLTSSKDVNFNLTDSIIIYKNILSNLKKVLESNQDISLSLVETVESDLDIESSLLKNTSEDYNIEISLAKEEIVAFTSDIRWKLEIDKDINFALVKAVKVPAGLDSIEVYVGGSILTDVDNATVQWTWTMNDQIGECSFNLARYFDKFNNKLTGVASSLAVNQVIQIYFNSKLKFYGYINSLDVSSDRETVIVKGVDRKDKINQELCVKDYGRHSESGYESTNSILTYLLNDLVSKGLITSYSGVPTGVVVEYTTQDGMPYGNLITELLNQSGNYKWTVTPLGVLNIYEQGNGELKELSYQQSTRNIDLYDILDCRLVLNNIKELVTTAEVVMGTHSFEKYASYNKVVLSNRPLIPAWNRGQEGTALNAYGVPSVNYDEIFKKYIIPLWTDGSIIEEKFKPRITYNWVSQTVLQDGYWFNSTIQEHSSGLGQFLPKYTGFTIDNGIIKFPNTNVTILESYFNPSSEVQTISKWHVQNPMITMIFYQKQDIALVTYPNIFNVTSVGSGGAGQKRRLIMSNLGVSPLIYWNEYSDGILIFHYQSGYNDTAYATDRAKFFLSKINEPVSEGTFEMTLDGQDFFDLDLGKRVNIINTEDTTIYKNNNGFPLDIESISFNAGSYRCSMFVRNRKFYKCTESLQERYSD